MIDSYRFRDRREADMAAVLRIESASQVRPWTAAVFAKHFRREGTYCVVAEHMVDEKVVGYAVYSLGRSHVRLHNLAVDPDYRRRHLGKALVSHLQAKLSVGRRNRILVTVPERALKSQLFFQSLGFMAAYIFEPEEDGYVFHREPGDACYAMRYTLRSGKEVRI